MVSAGGSVAMAAKELLLSGKSAGRSRQLRSKFAVPSDAAMRRSLPPNIFIIRMLRSCKGWKCAFGAV